MSACTGTPISWLRLDRYQLGELGSDERREIARHLEDCDACRAVLARIEADVRELPPLPAPARDRPRRVWPLLRGRTAAVVSGLALAAALALIVGRRPRPTGDPGELATEVTRVKGNDVAISLVRDDDAVIADASGIYRQGDRFKVLVTCPPGMRASWDVVAYEGGQASFPLASPPPIACGNSVPLPGAFRVTGQERLTVCLVWSDRGGVDRESLRRSSPALLDDARCLVLDAAP